MSRVNVKVERGSTFSIFSTFHTLSLFHLHANFTRVHKIEVMYVILRNFNVRSYVI